MKKCYCLFLLFLLIGLNSYADTPSSINPSQAAVKPDDVNLLAWWKLDNEVGEVVDSSGNFRNGTASGITRGMPGRFGNAFLWDRTTDDFVSTTDFFDFWNLGSISLWYKRTTAHPVMAMMGKWNDTREDGWGVRFWGNHINFFYTNPSKGHHSWYSFDFFTDTQDWHHLVITFDKGNASSIQVYHDGNLLNGIWALGDGNIIPEDNSSRVVLGSLSNSPTRTFQTFNGSLDQIRIYNIQLDPSHVSWLFREEIEIIPPTPTSTSTSTPTPTFTPTPPPITTKLLYHFDTDFVDSSFSNHVPIVSGNARIDTSQSKFGRGSLFLDGSQSGLRINHNTDFDIQTDSDFTVEMWFKVNGSTIMSPNENFVRLMAGDNNRLTIWLDPLTIGAHFINSLDQNFSLLPSGNAIADGEWHHIAYTRIDESFHIYLDGSSIASGFADRSTQLDLDYILIGAVDGATQYFQGWIDEFRFTNGVARYSGDTYVVPDGTFIADIPPTPTPTQIPTSTPTPTHTPTQIPTPTPQGVFFQGIELAATNMVSDPPNGFSPGNVTYGEVEGTSDGIGMKVELNPGEGLLLISLTPIQSPGMMEITSQIQTSNAEPAVALIALNASFDGQFSFINLSSNAVPVGELQDVKLFYEPPDGQMLLGIQAVNPLSSVSSVSIVVDEINARIYEGSPLSLINTQVDGTFNEGLENLLSNFNNTTGDIIPIFKSLTDIAVQLTIQPDDIAANIGTSVINSSEHIPSDFFCSVDVSREGENSRGMFALVLTNGIQNYTLFQNTADFPLSTSSNTETLIGGASFFENNPSIPLTLIVQNGGTNIDSTVIIDNLFVSKR